jgi:hypothetical protein
MIFMDYLQPLEARWGRDRIHQAIQPLHLGDGEEPGDPEITVINAAVNDRPLWETLTDDEREWLFLAFTELTNDLHGLATDLYRVREPATGGYELADETTSPQPLTT